MIDHTSVHHSDFAQSKAFYTQALALKPGDWGAFVLAPNGQNMYVVCHGPCRA